MSYLRILVAVFTFAVGVSVAWAASVAAAGFGIFGMPFGQSEVIEVAAPNVPEPPAVRFKHNRKHKHHCRKFSEGREK